MTFSTSFQKQAKGKADTAIIGIYEGNILTTGAKTLNKGKDKSIDASLKNNPDFKGSHGDILSINCHHTQFNQIIIVGLGKKEDLTPISFEMLGGKLWDILKASKRKTAQIFAAGFKDGQKNSEATLAAHLAYSIELKSYDFNKYKTENKKKPNLKTVTALGQ